MSGKDRAPGPGERPGGNATIGRVGRRAGRGGTRHPAFGPPTADRYPGSANAGWVIISYLVTGMFIYGGLGWLIGHLLGSVAVAAMIGMLVGLALALTLVYFRYGRS